MQRALNLNKYRIAGTILLLAWKMGLYREEIHHLKWSDISFEEKLLHLPNRTVPMDDEIVAFLQERKNRRKDSLAEVAVSDRRRTHMLPQSISRVAREALDEVGLSDITLVELRHDFVIRQLEQHDWPYVARISGATVGTLYTNYSNYVRKTGGKSAKTETFPVDEQKLWNVIQAEGTSSEGLALWMSWKLHLNAGEIISLTWDQIDLEKAIIHFSDRSLPVEKDLMVRLFEVKAGRRPDADPHVLLTPQSQRPYDFARISRGVRTVLIRGGLEDITLRDIARMEEREEVSDTIMKYATENGSITRNEIMEILSVTKPQAYKRLQRLIESGQLVKVGAKYYPAGAVVPPERQYEVIRAHLEMMKSAYCQEIADLLRIGNRQCSWILRNMVEEGKLNRKGQMYVLPEAKKK